MILSGVYGFLKAFGFPIEDLGSDKKILHNPLEQSPESGDFALASLLLPISYQHAFYKL